MRTFLSGLLTLIAMAAVIVAVPATWTAERLVDHDGFAQLVTPLAGEPAVQGYLADQITDEVTSRVPVPGSAAVVAPLARSYTHSDQFRADFVDIVSQQHDWLFSAPPADESQDTLRLDITGMVNRVLANSPVRANLSGQRVVIPLSEGHTGLRAGRYHQLGEQIQKVEYIAGAVAVLAALLALLLAWRRSTVLAALGIGVLLAALASWAAARYLGMAGRDEVSGARGAGKSVADTVISAAQHDLDHVAAITALVGAAMLVLGVLGRLFAGRGDRRR